MDVGHSFYTAQKRGQDLGLTAFFQSLHLQKGNFHTSTPSGVVTVALNISTSVIASKTK